MILPENNKFHITTYILILLASLFWASAFVGIRIGLKSYSPDTLALLRYMAASIIMIPLYFKYRKTHKKLAKNEIIRIILLGILGIAIYNVTLNHGEQTISSGIASFIISQSPVCMLLFAMLFLKERINYLSWIGIFISTLGITLIAFSKWQGGQLTWNIAYIFIASVVAAAYSIMQKPLLIKFHGIELTALAIWSGTAVMLIFLPKLIIEIPHASATATWAAVYMGIFPGALAYAAWSMILARMPASQAAGYLYITPILTTLLGWLFLGEIPLLLALLGGIIALLGAVIIHYNRN